MSNKERKENELRTMSDIFTDALEDAEYEGRISKKQKENWYRRLTTLELKDLRPKKPKLSEREQRALKKAIKKRTNGGLEHVVPSPIPGDKPPDISPTRSARIRGVFARFKPATA